jgi:hypothetical protein
VQTAIVAINSLNNEPKASYRKHNFHYLRVYVSCSATYGGNRSFRTFVMTYPSLQEAAFRIPLHPDTSVDIVPRSDLVHLLPVSLEFTVQAVE